MSKIPQEVIKELIKCQKFNNTQEVMQTIIPNNFQLKEYSKQNGSAANFV